MSDGLQNALFRVASLGDVPAMNEDPAPFQNDVAQISEKYPVIGKHLSNFEIGWGAPQQGENQLEFFPPWESDNPRPGVPYIELYNRGLSGQALQDAIAGDSLHYLAAVHPEVGEAVDPAWRQMRDEFSQTITPDQKKVDREAYTQEGDPRSFGDWFDSSRLDAYLRGYLFPDASDEWHSTYSGDQVKLLERMRQYLQGVQNENPAR